MVASLFQFVLGILLGVLLLYTIITLNATNINTITAWAFDDMPTQRTFVRLCLDSRESTLVNFWYDGHYLLFELVTVFFPE